MLSNFPKSLEEAVSYVLSLNDEDKDQALSSLPQYELEGDTEEFLSSIPYNLNEEWLIKCSLLQPIENRDLYIVHRQSNRQYINRGETITFYKNIVKAYLELFDSVCTNESEKQLYKDRLNQLLINEVIIKLNHDSGEIDYNVLLHIGESFLDGLITTGLFEALNKNFLTNNLSALSLLPEELQVFHSKLLLGYIERKEIIDSVAPELVHPYLAKFYNDQKRLLLTYTQQESNKITSKSSIKQNGNEFKQLEWRGSLKKNANQIPALYEALSSSEAKYIDCNQEVFFGIFSPYPFLEPVRWLTNNASELIFFILGLQEKDFLPTPKRQSWQALKKLFIKSDGSHFVENFKTLRINIKMNLSQAKQDSISQIIESIN
jgi:hypothetical protein